MIWVLGIVSILAFFWLLLLETAVSRIASAIEAQNRHYGIGAPAEDSIIENPEEAEA